MSNNNTPIAAKVGFFLSDFKWLLLQISGFILIVLVRFYPTGIENYEFSNIDYFLLIGLVIWGIGTLFGELNKRDKEKKLKNYEEIKVQLNDEQEFHYNTKKKFQDSVENLFVQLMRLLVENKLEFSACDRISFYYHKNSTEEFILMARYSEHPKFGKPKRFKFPNNQGCIFKAWESYDGVHFKPALPEFGTANYLQIMKDDYNMDDEALDELRMPSRFYFAQSVKNNRNERLGVIVIESTEVNRFNEESLKDICNNNSNLLTEFLEHNHRLDPTIKLIK